MAHAPPQACPARGRDPSGALEPGCRMLAFGEFTDGSVVSGFDLKPSMINSKHVPLDRLRKVCPSQKH